MSDRIVRPHEHSVRPSGEAEARSIAGSRGRGLLAAHHPPFQHSLSCIIPAARTCRSTSTRAVDALGDGCAVRGSPDGALQPHGSAGTTSSRYEPRHAAKRASRRSTAWRRARASCGSSRLPQRPDTCRGRTGWWLRGMWQPRRCTTAPRVSWYHQQSLRAAWCTRSRRSVSHSIGGRAALSPQPARYSIDTGRSLCELADV